MAYYKVEYNLNVGDELIFKIDNIEYTGRIKNIRNLPIILVETKYPPINITEYKQYNIDISQIISCSTSSWKKDKVIYTYGEGLEYIWDNNHLNYKVIEYNY